MRVDEAWHQRRVAEVDELCSGRMSNAGAYGCDAFAFDADFSGRDDRSCCDVEHSCGVEDDYRLRLGCLSVAGRRCEADCKAAEEDFHGSSSIP